MTAGTGTYRSLSWGPGTRYPVAKLEEPRGMPGVRARDLSYAERHGAASLPDYADTRTLVLTLGIRGDDHAGLEQLSEDVRQATPPAAGTSPLVFRDGTRLVYAKPRRRSLPEDAEHLWRLGEAVVEFVCPDPREYDAVEQSASAQLPPSSASGGVVWPLVWPLVFGTAPAGNGTGVLTIQNRGNVDAPVRLRVDGPIVNPAIFHQESGKLLTLNLTITQGDFLLIDTEARTVLLNGTASRRSALVAGSSWPTLQPGTNTFRLTGTQGTSAPVNMVLNPSMETATGTLVVRQNLFTNPNALNNVNNWSAFAGTGGTAAIAQRTGQTGWWFATTSARVTWSVATSAVGGGLVFTAGGIVPARHYSGMVQVRCNKVQRVVFNVDWYTAGSVFISSSVSAATVLAANTVTTLNITDIIAPANAASANVTINATAGTSGTNWAAADWLEGTHCQIEETDQVLIPGGFAANDPQSAIRCAFVGDFAPGAFGPDYTFGWSGAAHASISEVRAPALDNYNAGASTDCPSTRSTEVAPLFGAYVQRIRWATAAINSEGDAQTVSGFTVGQLYTYSRYVWVPTGSPDAILSIDSIGTSVATSLKNQWVRLSMTFTAIATTAVIRILPNQAAVKGDDRVLSDGAMVEPGVVLNPYSDTDNPRYVPQLVATARSAWL